MILSDGPLARYVFVSLRSCLASLFPQVNREETPFILTEGLHSYMAEFRCGGHRER